MIKRTFVRLMAGVALLGMSGSACAEAPKPGAAAPAFTVVDLDGKQHSLSSFAGKIVVLEWNNFDCPFVARHYKNGNLPALQKKYTGKGVVWLAVNSSAPGKQGHYEPAAMKERVAKEGFAGTAYVYDSNGEAGKAYGAPTTPTMAVIDGKGILRYWGALDDNPKGEGEAKNYVAAALDAIIAGKEVETTTTKPYGCGVKY